MRDGFYSLSASPVGSATYERIFGSGVWLQARPPLGYVRVVWKDRTSDIVEENALFPGGRTLDDVDCFVMPNGEIRDPVR